MSKDLGSRTALSAIDNSGVNPWGNGFWVGQITPRVWGVVPSVFDVYHMAILGPTGSQLQVWVDQEYYSSTPRGDVNEWDPKQPLRMRSGQTLYFYWDTGGSSFPQRITSAIAIVRIRETSIV